MRAERNRQRIAVAQAQDALRLDAHLDAALGLTPRYVAYDDTGNSWSSRPMTALRTMLMARAAGTLDTQLVGMPAMSEIASLCVPPAVTYDDTPLARGYFAAYAEAAMRLATTRHLAQWVETYRAKVEGRDAWALDILCRQTLRGLAMLRDACGTDIARERSDYAASATLDAAARRAFSSAEHVAWHGMTDNVKPYANSGRLSRQEKRVKYGHHARKARKRERERMA